VCVCPCLYTGVNCQICNFCFVFLSLPDTDYFEVLMNNFFQDTNPCISNPCGANSVCTPNLATCCYTCVASKIGNLDFKSDRVLFFF